MFVAEGRYCRQAFSICKHCFPFLCDHQAALGEIQLLQPQLWTCHLGQIGHVLNCLPTPFFSFWGGKGFQTLLLFKSPWPFDTKARQIGWYRAAAAAIYRQQFSQKGQVFSHCPSKPYLGIHPIDASKWLPWNIMEVLVLQSILKCYHTSISRLQFCSLIKITTSPTPWLKMASNVNKWNQFANKWVTLIHHPHRWNVDVNLVHLLSQITSDPTF